MTRKLTERTPTDRRDEDIGPPAGWKDRRHTTERRIPTVEEATVSEDEWLAYFTPRPTGTAANQPGAKVREISAKRG